MENMRNMLHGVVVYVLFFTVQSYEERIFTSETPISDGKSDSNARTGISKEPKYGPRTASIMRNNQTISGDIIMKENTSMTIPLRCASSCNPPCKIAWYINGQLDPRDNPVINIKLDRKVSGVYQCEASGEEGKVEADPVNVTIQYGPITASVLSNNQMISGDIIVKEDNYKTIALRCKSSCYPPCEIAWYRDGQLDPRNNTVIDITLARRKSGVYHCEASGVEGKVKSDPVHVIIQYGPRTTSVLRNYHTISGDIIEKEETSMTIPLRCSSSCNPPCKIAWYRDTQLHSRNNSIITIRRDRGMSGVYHCEASGVEGKVVSAQVHVTIQYPPGSVTITPGNNTFYTKRNGKPVQNITCKADCLPECTYEWYREGHRSVYMYTTGSSLFARQTYFYKGSYRFRCLASNNIRSNYSRWITVEEKDGPDNVTIIPLSSVKDKSPFQLTCSAKCLYGCQSFVWYFNSKSMTQSTPILTFPSLSKEDSGNYLCRVTDDFGSTYSEYYKVNVKDGPKNVTIQYSSRYGNLIEGRDYITFTCNADCNPECSYLFYQNEKLVSERYTRELVHRNMSGPYTCSANNTAVNTLHMHSSNVVYINIKYKPTITSFANRKILTAPDLLYLTFSVDSFPSSNVTIFHETKPLTFIPNVTGQLSFNVSIESCLDQGEYRVEAVNDAGSDRFIFIADVKCSPIVVRYSNVSHKKFRVGDLLHLTVAFMANPTAEVLWSFVPWNKNTSLEVQTHQIQNHKESTKIVFILSDTNKFGKYILELKNELGKTSKEFDIQGPTMEATKTDLLTTISSQESDSNGDISMSPTSWKGKASALRETEMNTFLLQEDKLQEEVQKLRLEGDVLRLKRNYYVIKLQLLMKEHPGVINEVFGDN